MGRKKECDKLKSDVIYPGDQKTARSTLIRNKTPLGKAPKKEKKAPITKAVRQPKQKQPTEKKKNPEPISFANSTVPFSFTQKDIEPQPRIPTFGGLTNSREVPLFLQNVQTAPQSAFTFNFGDSVPLPTPTATTATSVPTFDFAITSLAVPEVPKLSEKQYYKETVKVFQFDTNKKKWGEASVLVLTLEQEEQGVHLVARVTGGGKVIINTLLRKGHFIKDSITQEAKKVKFQCLNVVGVEPFPMVTFHLVFREEKHKSELLEKIKQYYLH